MNTSSCRLDQRRRSSRGSASPPCGGAPSLPLSRREAQSRSRRFVIREDRFGRLFPDLPPFAENSPALDAALRDIGRPGGMLDARDELAAGPAAS